MVWLIKFKFWVQKNTFRVVGVLLVLMVLCSTLSYICGFMEGTCSGREAGNFDVADSDRRLEQSTARVFEESAAEIRRIHSDAASLYERLDRSNRVFDERIKALEDDSDSDIGSVRDASGGE